MQDTPRASLRQFRVITGERLPDGQIWVTCAVEVLKTREFDILEFLEVERFDPETRLGFQRGLNENHVKDIAKGLAEGGILDDTIKVICRDYHQPVYDPRAKSLVATGGVVCDGQHRLEAIRLVREWKIDRDSIKVLMNFYIGLTEAQERERFVLANALAMRVTPAHLAEVRAGTSLATSAEQRANPLFDELVGAGGPLHCLAYDGVKSKMAKNNRRTFARAVDPLIKERGPLKSYALNDRCAIVKMYVQAAVNWMDIGEPSESRVFELSRPQVLAAILAVLPSVIGRIRARGLTITVDNLMSEMSALQDFSVSKLKDQGLTVSKSNVKEALSGLEIGDIGRSVA